MGRVREKLTYGNVMSTLALFIALGGVSWAATDGESVTSDEIDPGAVRGQHLHGSVSGDPKPGPPPTSVHYEGRSVNRDANLRFDVTEQRQIVNLRLDVNTSRTYECRVELQRPIELRYDGSFESQGYDRVKYEFRGRFVTSDSGTFDYTVVDDKRPVCPIAPDTIKFSRAPRQYINGPPGWRAVSGRRDVAM